MFGPSVFESLKTVLSESIPSVSRLEIYSFIFFALNYTSMIQGGSLTESVRKAKIAAQAFLDEFENEEK